MARFEESAEDCPDKQNLKELPSGCGGRATALTGSERGMGNFKPALSGEFHTGADSQELGTACGERQSRGRSNAPRRDPIELTCSQQA
jgi:hypothetical protein